MKTILAAVAALSLTVGTAYTSGAPVGSFHGSYAQDNAATAYSAHSGAATRGG